MSRFEAAWYTPAIVLYRMQRAYLDRQGEEQKWAKSAGDKLMEAENGE